MTQTTSEKLRWTTGDLELLPDNGNIYEIIDGELFVTKTPHWGHQNVSGRIFAALDDWSITTNLGEASLALGIIFSNGDNVIPDVVWASNDCLSALLDEAGHLTGAPELAVEVLSPGKENERRDKQTKLKLYSNRGVREYWICDRFLQTIEIYRRKNAVLKLTATLFNNDVLTSPLLPGFTCQVARIFA
ncbi:MAG: Uma2 family endonuclease [Cyanobacteriota bacterium]|nr:Uma2 family endonuclease [Cyanobacteriota bacterium]